jgi:hypothetical protein
MSFVKIGPVTVLIYLHRVDDFLPLVPHFSTDVSEIRRRRFSYDIVQQMEVL